jgi:TIR domain-containing protein
MKAAPQIFLSYVRTNKDRVEDLYKRLVSEGFIPWMDHEDVVAGELWKTKIHKAIRDSDFFLACLSKESVNKRGFLQREIKNALEIWREKLPDDIYLIPVRLEECTVPDDLTDFHWVDLFENDGWNRLLKALRIGVERRTGPDRRKQEKKFNLLAESQRRGAKDRSLITQVPERPEDLATETPLTEKIPALVRLTAKLPIVTFPDELSNLIQTVENEAWENLAEDERRFLVTIGTKLEPIVQVIPQTPVPLVIAFETLALGSLGENFSQICARVPGLDPGLLRLLLTLASMKTASMLRVNAAEVANVGVRNLLFSLNLDPEMLDCPHLEDFLDRYQFDLGESVLFEVNEKTTSKYLRRLKELQVDFNLRYCADDFNNWAPEVKEALKNRVEMSKVDNNTFLNAMAVRGDDPKKAVELILEHRIPGKPLIVEGIEDRNYLRFLDRHWPLETHGSLFGQGYIVLPGKPWDEWTMDLRNFGLPGGHFMNNPVFEFDLKRKLKRQ